LYVGTSDDGPWLHFPKCNNCIHAGGGCNSIQPRTTRTHWYEPAIQPAWGKQFRPSVIVKALQISSSSSSFLPSFLSQLTAVKRKLRNAIEMTL
jgi:hypothetical protein